MKKIMIVLLFVLLVGCISQPPSTNQTATPQQPSYEKINATQILNNSYNELTRLRTIRGIRFYNLSSPQNSSYYTSAYYVFSFEYDIIKNKTIENIQTVYSVKNIPQGNETRQEITNTSTNYTVIINNTGIYTISRNSTISKGGLYFYSLVGVQVTNYSKNITYLGDENFSGELTHTISFTTKTMFGEMWDTDVIVWISKKNQIPVRVKSIIKTSTGNIESDIGYIQYNINEELPDADFEVNP